MRINLEDEWAEVTANLFAAMLYGCTKIEHELWLRLCALEEEM